MLWLRMIAVALRLLGPYVLIPWRSPLLRWRMETYGILSPDGQLLHADQLTISDAIRFTLHRRRELCRFLRWAAYL